MVDDVTILVMNMLGQLPKTIPIGSLSATSGSSSHVHIVQPKDKTPNSIPILMRSTRMSQPESDEIENPTAFRTHTGITFGKSAPMF